MLSLTNTNANILQSLPEDTGELEKLFSEVVLFEHLTRKQRVNLIDKVVACLLSLGFRQINTGTELYRALFLWYIKYTYNGADSIFKIEENMRRFQTIYDMEVEYHSIMCQKKESCHLWRSRASKCFK